jgi:hypothetical protein
MNLYSLQDTWSTMTRNEYMKNALQLRHCLNEIRIDFVWNIIAQLNHRVGCSQSGGSMLEKRTPVLIRKQTKCSTDCDSEQRMRNASIRCRTKGTPQIHLNGVPYSFITT